MLLRAWHISAKRFSDNLHAHVGHIRSRHSIALEIYDVPQSGHALISIYFPQSSIRSPLFLKPHSIIFLPMVKFIFLCSVHLTKRSFCDILFIRGNQHFLRIIAVRFCENLAALFLCLYFTTFPLECQPLFINNCNTFRFWKILVSKYLNFPTIPPVFSTKDSFFFDVQGDEDKKAPALVAFSPSYQK